MATKQYSLRTFGGLQVDKHPRSIDPGNSPDCKNMRVDSLLGTIRNDVGMEKTVTSRFTDSIVGIHQLEDMNRYAIIDTGLVPLSYRHFGSYGTGNGQFTAEYDDKISVGVYNDEVYVGDTRGQRIMVFTKYGVYSRQWSVSRIGIINAVHVDASASEVYVALRGYPDTAQTKIIVYDLNGNFKREWGTYGWTVSNLNNPFSVFVYAGEVYVANAPVRIINVFDTNGVYKREWHYAGTADSIRYPTGIWVDSGEVFVSDEQSNYGIHVFTTAGVLLRRFCYAIDPITTNKPKDLCVYNDEVYIADTYNYNIKVFSRAGVFARKWSTYGTGEGQVTYPTGIFVYPADLEVYVADNGNLIYPTFNFNRIHAFNLIGSGY
jgi:DNA-binding beta-propeller fold protein YncE